MTKVCAIIPLYNEEAYAGDTINALRKIDIIDTVLVVDDGSKDNTWNIIRQIEGIVRIRHISNEGKSKSLWDGVKSIDSDIYVFLDGDLGSSVLKVEKLIREVIDNNCDMCIAKIPEAENGGGFGLLRSFSKFMVKFFTSQTISCSLSGQRVIKKELLFDKRIRFYSGYGVETGMLIDAIRCGYRIKYIEVDLKHRVTGKDLKGFIHRFIQFKDVLFVFFYELLR